MGGTPVVHRAVLRCLDAETTEELRVAVALRMRLTQNRFSTTVTVAVKTSGGHTMTVFGVTQTSVPVGGWEEALAGQKQAKGLMERHGAKNYRAMFGMVAGEATGVIASTWEADDYAAHGAIMDKILADPEVQALMAGAPTGWRTTSWVEVPL